MQLRLARNKDGNQIINLIKRCFKDYKNCYLDVDNDSPELKIKKESSGCMLIKIKLSDAWVIYHMKKIT